MKRRREDESDHRRPPVPRSVDFFASSPPVAIQAVLCSSSTSAEVVNTNDNDEDEDSDIQELTDSDVENQPETKRSSKVVVGEDKERCDHPGCTNVPTHLHPRLKMGGFYCSQHKRKGMVHFMKEKCEYPGCWKCPGYTFPWEKLRRCCSQHRIQGMIRIDQNCCEHPRCWVSATFNYPGEESGSWCSQHKKKGMVKVGVKSLKPYMPKVGVRDKRCCEYPDCTKRPSFNYRGEKLRRFCSKHKEEGMVNLDILFEARRCRHPGCMKRSSFNYQGERSRWFCAEHKEEGMVNMNKNVVKKKCEHPDCTKWPSFNYQGETLRRFCVKHKEKGMVNTQRCRNPPLPHDVAWKPTSQNRTGTSRLDVARFGEKLSEEI